MPVNKTIDQLKKPLLWTAFVIFCLIATYTMLHHELWGDEIHSWNIAKGSGSFFELIVNTRYEGHPPLWYIVLWTISKFTHDPFAIQVVHLAIAWSVVFLIIFYAPFSLPVKLLVPFGYYFLFEYTILSRNYVIGILLACIICIIIHKNLREKIFWYYLLLLLLSNSHLLSLLLAAGFHVYFLLLEKERPVYSRSVFLHLFAGLVIFLPGIYFVFPPSDSALSTNYWIDRWNFDQLSSIAQAPVRAFIPVPDWNDHHFWDTQFLITRGYFYSLPLWSLVLISTGIILFCLALFRPDKKVLYFFLSNLVLIALVSFIIPFTNSRHVGFIFISFLLALWLYCHRNSLTITQNRIIFFLLLLQLPGSLIAISKDLKYPFSNGYMINELLRSIPSGKVVTDYWCLNNLAAFTDGSFYNIDTQKEQVFLLWDSELGSALKKVDRYSGGISAYMKREQLTRVYLLSTQRLEKLKQLDEKLFSMFTVSLFDKREGAIEKGGNLYIYEITAN